MAACEPTTSNRVYGEFVYTDPYPEDDDGAREDTKLTGGAYSSLTTVPKHADFMRVEETADTNVKDIKTPLLSRYDPYHDTTYYVHHPFTQLPITSIDIESESFKYNYLPSQPASKLAYEDFAPNWKDPADDYEYEGSSLRPVENYGDIIERANAWLRQNPHVEVRTCETVTWSTVDMTQVGDTETVIMEKCTCPYAPSNELDSIYLMGLRLWLTAKTPGEESQKIRYQDFKPIEKGSLSRLIKKVNRDLDEKPLRGQIINFETVLCPLKHPLDTSKTYWREKEAAQGKYKVVLRVFYAECETRRQTVGVKNIVPETSTGFAEPFGHLIKKVSQWVNTEPDVKVINMKSVYVSRDGDSPLDAADRCTQYYMQYGAQQYFQILRVFYVRESVRARSYEHMLNCMTFTPVQTDLGPNTLAMFERMKHTMLRVTAWLEAAGADILCVETVTTTLVPSMPTHTIPEVTYWTPATAITNTEHRKLLMHIRVYLDGDFIEPDPKLLPPLPASLTDALQATVTRMRLNSKRQKRKRRKRILIFIAIGVILVTGGIILLDQAFNIFKFGSKEDGDG